MDLPVLSLYLSNHGVYTYRIEKTRVGAVLCKSIQQGSSEKCFYFRPVGNIVLVYFHHKLTVPVPAWIANPRKPTTRSTTILMCKMTKEELVSNLLLLEDTILSKMQSTATTLHLMCDYTFKAQPLPGATHGV